MRAELADGRILEFPDGTDPAVIQATVKKLLSDQQQPATAQPAMTETVQPEMEAATQEPSPSQTGFIAPDTSLKPGGEEALGTMMSGMVAEPLAGLAGLLSLPFTDAGQAEKNIEAVRDALTFIPRSEAGMQQLQRIAETLQPVGEAMQTAEQATGGAAFEATGSPLAGAVGATVPTAALEAAGLGVIRRGARAAKSADAAAQARKAADAADIKRVRETLDVKDETQAAVNAAKPKTDPLDSIKAGEPPEAQSYEQVLKNIQREKTKKAVIDAMPDDEILQAAKDLGVDLNPDHYSGNRVFRELTQRLKDRPGSKLGAIEEKAIRDLGKRADDLIDEIGGQTDKTLLDANVKNSIYSTIDDLDAQAGVAYKLVDNAIPKAAKVEPAASQAYIKQVLSDLGGDKSQLSTAEKKLFAIMNTNPTYSALDRLRKDVGSGFRKKAGPFKDDNEGTLKQVYRVLSEDQQGVSDSFGVGADYAAARRLVASRKQIEDQAIKLFGREAQASIVPKLKSASAALTKGDTSKFNLLMKSLPESRRAEAAATLLNDLFTQGARTGQPLGQGFVKAFEGLNRNAGAKNILFDQLPKDARIRFDKIGRVATGIYRSKALENTSKTAGSLIAAMDDGGMFSKVYEIGRKAALAEGVTSAMGAPGVGGGAVLASALTKGRTTATQAADAFITSRKFKEAIEQAAKTGNAKKADDVLKSSKEYNKWKRHLSKEDAKKLAAVGFIPWVTGQTEEEQE